MNERLIQSILPSVQALRIYHRHEVIGMGNLPKDGPTLLVLNHSLATYDMSLLFAAIYLETQRLPRPLADHLFFKIPYLGALINACGAMEGSRQNAHQLLLDKNIVAVAPGGMREALRPSSERYQIMWEQRRGFAKMSIETQTPIVVAVCPKADDIYHVYPTPITKWAYKKFKIPLFLAKGMGPTLIPRPVKLVHFLSRPIVPPFFEGTLEEIPEDMLINYHRKILRKTRELIGDAIAYRPLPPARRKTS